MKYQDVLKKAEELLANSNEAAKEYKGLRYTLFVLGNRTDLEDAPQDEIIKEIQSLAEWHNGRYRGLGNARMVAGIEALLNAIR